jgi:hypothetical protein
MMKRTFAALTTISLTYAASAQLPNASFEAWSTVGTFLEPDHWATLNSLVQAGTPLAERVAGSDGAYALKMTTRSVFGTPVASGVSSGAFDGTGFPWSQRSAALEGVLKFSPAAEGEACAIAISLSHWVPGVGRVYHGEGYLEWDVETTGWTGFSVPIAYSDASSPDSAKIILTSSTGAAVVAGTEFQLDALTFADPATALAEDKAGPNNAVRVHTLGERRYVIRAEGRAELAELIITSATGGIIQQVPCNGPLQALDLSPVAPGVYIVSVLLKDGSRVVTRLVDR